MGQYHLAIVLNEPYTHKPYALFDEFDAQLLARRETGSKFLVSLLALRERCLSMNAKEGDTYTSLSAWLPIGAAMYFTPLMVVSLPFREV